MPISLLPPCCYAETNQCSKQQNECLCIKYLFCFMSWDAILHGLIFRILYIDHTHLQATGHGTTDAVSSCFSWFKVCTVDCHFDIALINAYNSLSELVHKYNYDTCKAICGSRALYTLVCTTGNLKSLTLLNLSLNTHYSDVTACHLVYFIFYVCLLCYFL